MRRGRKWMLDSRRRKSCQRSTKAARRTRYVLACMCVCAVLMHAHAHTQFSCTRMRTCCRNKLQTKKHSKCCRQWAWSRYSRASQQSATSSYGGTLGRTYVKLHPAYIHAPHTHTHSWFATYEYPPLSKYIPCTWIYEVVCATRLSRCEPVRPHRLPSEGTPPNIPQNK